MTFKYDVVYWKQIATYFQLHYYLNHDHTIFFYSFVIHDFLLLRSDMMHANFLKYFTVSFVLLLIVTLANSQEKNKGVERVQDDMKVLQGNWIYINQKVNAQFRLNFDKSVMIAKYVREGGKTKTIKGKFELDSTTEPKKFDFIGKEDPAGANLELIGIYELTENEFKLMLIEKGLRPTEFKKTKGSYVEFKRDIG